MSRQALAKNKQYYIFEGLQHFNRGITCAFTARGLGNMSLFYGDTNAALDNRKRFLEEIGIDYQDLVCAKQVHGSETRIVSEEDRGRGALAYDSAIADTDALVTSQKNLPLAVFTADCLTVFLYDADTPSIGLVHAGWRSTKEHITAKTIALMQEKFHSKPGSLYACFGAAIRGCCYEVGGEFRENFSTDLLQRDNRFYLDLFKANRKQVMDTGVSEDKIFDSGICTCCRSNEFFSYRKEKRSCGRMMSVIMLR